MGLKSPGAKRPGPKSQGVKRPGYETKTTYDDLKIRWL